MSFTQTDLVEIAKKSNAAICAMDKDYHRIQTYVSGDKLYCVHIAPDEETVRKHSALGCFPVDNVYEVGTIIDPSTTG